MRGNSIHFSSYLQNEMLKILVAIECCNVHSVLALLHAGMHCLCSAVLFRKTIVNQLCLQKYRMLFIFIALFGSEPHADICSW
jgi:hypothetical protein